MTTATLITVLTQLGLAAAAYRLANRLAVRVERHDTQIGDHDTRIGVLEKRAA